MNQYVFTMYCFFSFTLFSVVPPSLAKTNKISDESALTNSIGKQDIQVGFSPYGNALNLVVDAIDKAQQEIMVATYTFTSKPISIALLEASKRGVKVFVVSDKKSNSGKYTSTRFLSNHEIPVCLTNRYTIMHNKFMIIDGSTVETGSFNYSAAAVKSNAENVIIIHNSDVAKLYREEFVRLFKECNESTYKGVGTQRNEN